MAHCNVNDEAECILFDDRKGCLLPSLPAHCPKVHERSEDDFWVPVHIRPLTEEEQEEYPDYAFMIDSPLPPEGEDILVTDGKHVWVDVFYNDYYAELDSGREFTNGLAWRRFPAPWSEKKEEQANGIRNK